jgi:hypothetical protein
LSAKPSRLLSCPEYFWYSAGRPAASFLVPTYFMYQFAIICVPSGLIDGITMLMTLSSARAASASVRERLS